jgi:hypothetical protein
MRPGGGGREECEPSSSPRRCRAGTAPRRTSAIRPSPGRDLGAPRARRLGTSDRGHGRSLRNIRKNHRPCARGDFCEYCEWVLTGRTVECTPPVGGPGRVPRPVAMVGVGHGSGELLATLVGPVVGLAGAARVMVRGRFRRDRRDDRKKDDRASGTRPGGPAAPPGSFTLAPRPPTRCPWPIRGFRQPRMRRHRGPKHVRRVDTRIRGRALLSAAPPLRLAAPALPNAFGVVHGVGVAGAPSRSGTLVPRHTGRARSTRRRGIAVRVWDARATLSGESERRPGGSWPG